MTSRALAGVAVVLFTTGCGLFRHSSAVSAQVTRPPAPQVAVLPADAAPAPERRVGDFFVHRFSGAFSGEPLTLSEEVVAREGDSWVVDYALSQSERLERLRVRFDAKTGEALTAARLHGSAESAATLMDYEVLMARTIYSADVNDGLLSTSAQACLVGAEELDCETKTYKVWVGDAPATLSVVHSARFADRDVAGEITTDDGKLIYRAELLEVRRGSTTRGVASRY